MKVVKYYCDRFRKETRTRKKITIKGNYNPSILSQILSATALDAFVVRAFSSDFQICLECYNEFRKWIDGGIPHEKER